MRQTQSDLLQQLQEAKEEIKRLKKIKVFPDYLEVCKRITDSRYTTLPYNEYVQVGTRIMYDMLWNIFLTLQDKIDELIKEAREEIKEWDKESQEAKRENERLKSALSQSVNLIKQWRQKAAASSGKSKEIIEDIWLEYYFNAPEMKDIREELKDDI